MEPGGSSPSAGVLMRDSWWTSIPIAFDGQFVYDME
jgi:hypothetical protein